MNLWYPVWYPAYQKLLMSHLLSKAWRQVFPQSGSLEIYFTHVDCGMSVTREDYHLVFTQNFSSVDYSFVYADNSNNDVGLIQRTTDRADTP